MKILAIRGCNLASLAGEFEIDLARAPLGGAGVFAIVGNTGAGKSTLLDALCVALFDRTPRLTNHSTVKVGRGVDERALLGAQDVRTLLRRGTAQGWAEVDFESGDARQYRARWSVRRARGQSDGTLQDEQLSLTAIHGGERFGGTKTETLKAIHARLGLSFDQFRRSALLAQGEFAAFLRADGKDRSELLERMTGTQIYSRLSIAAHVKAALAEQRLRDGRAAALAIAVLDDEVAVATRAELEVATAAAHAARRRHGAAEQAARWVAEAKRRARELADATAEHTAARAALIGAEADRAELALRRRAEQLRPAWDQVVRLERAVAVATDEVASATAAAARAADELAAIAERRVQLAAIQAPVRAARIAAGIVERDGVAGARAQIARDAAAGPATPSATRPVPASRDGTRDPFGDWPKEFAGVAADDAAWLVARSALAPEIAAWPELDARFAQHGALGDALAALDRAQAEQAESKAKLERSHKVLAGELRAALHKHEDAKRKAASYSQKRGLTLDAARRLEDEARIRLGEIERLVAIAAGARAQIHARDEIDHQLAQLAAGLASDRARQAELAETQRFAQALRAEQARAVDDLRRAAGYEHARAELVEHEPCPLCGATEHPWRDRGVLDGVIASATQRLDRTLAELDALATEIAAICARGQHHERERARLTAQRAAIAASEPSAVLAWRAQLSALGELLLVDDPATSAAEDLAADRQGGAKRALEEARATRSQTEAATKAAQEAQAEVQLCQVAVDQLAGKLAELDRRLAELDAALSRGRGERASKQEHHAVLASELGAAMSRWAAALPAGDVEEPSVRMADIGTAGKRQPTKTTARAAHVGANPGADANAVTARAGGHPGRVRGAELDNAGTGQQSTPMARRAHVGAIPGDDISAAIAATTGADDEASSHVQVGTGELVLDPVLALALVGRLQASAALRPARDVMPSSPLAIVRLAMAAVVAVWRERADRIAQADAVLSAAMVAIESAGREADRAVAEHTARRGDAQRRRAALVREHAVAVERLEAARVAAGFGPGRATQTGAPGVPAGTGDVLEGAPLDELGRLLSADPSRVDALAERLAALERAVERTRAVVVERERQVAEHAAARPAFDGIHDPALAREPRPRDPDRATGGDPQTTGSAGFHDGRRDDDASTDREITVDPLAALADPFGGDPSAQVGILAAAVAAADRRAAQLAHMLAADEEARQRRAEALAELSAEEAGAEVDRVLGDVIGSHDGKLFRSFAQSLTLDSLLAVANAHLEELAPRYQLERVPRHDLELQVIDRDLGSEVRSVQSLSGGESFLVSLALALGLSSMSAHDVRVRTLLIDEGFGTLDPSTLDSALSVLDALQASGRQVGVISHVPALVERVGAHVRVVQRGGGRSEVIVA